MKDKNDWILALSLFGAGVVLLLVLFVFHKEGAFVSVTSDGTLVAQYSLADDGRYELIGFGGGKNTLVIEDGSAYFLDADCPDQICVKTGRIKNTGETIICLPHRIVCEIVDKEEDAAIDAVSQ